MEDMNETVETVPASVNITFTELIYGTLFKPGETFRKVAKAKPVFKCFLVFSGVILLNMLTGIILAPHSLAKGGLPANLAEVIGGILPFLAIIGAVFAYLNWVVLAGLFSLFAEFFTGQGSALGIFSVMGLVELPRLATLPLQVIGAVSGKPFLTTFFSILAGFIYFIWWAVLMVIGIREAHSLTTGRAVAVVAAPVFLIALALIVISIAGLGLMMPLLNVLNAGGIM